MQRNLIQRCLILLSLGMTVAALFAGCQFFAPDIKDNMEPPLEGAQGEGDFGGEKTTQK